MQVKDLVLGERLRNAGLTGITLGILALIACELPLILVLFGLSGLGAGAWAFELAPLVENVGFVAGGLGMAFLMAHTVRRMWNRRADKG